MTNVKLRKKPIAGSKERLYLDFYPPILHPDKQNRTRWKFLELYIYSKPKTDLEKTHNSETLALAESIRAKRQIEIQNRCYDFLSDSKYDSSFLDYFQGLIDKREEKSRGAWDCALVYLKEFTGGKIRFADINVKFCNDFKEYVLKAKRIKSPKRTISQNTAQSYFNRLKAALKQAYKDGLLKTDISVQVERIKDAETERPFLTIDELNKLINTECGYPTLKEAALFSALTGLRFSDIEKLQWGEVYEERDTKGDIQYSLHFIQKKTKGSEVLPISKQAYELLGVRGKINDKVFDGLHYSAFINFHLKRWILEAGITKKITFHCFRHTYATLQLNAGTDLYTVSKLLGHRDIKTTQIYAKVMDVAKQVAANRIVLDFPTKLRLIEND